MAIRGRELPHPRLQKPKFPEQNREAYDRDHRAAKHLPQSLFQQMRLNPLGRPRGDQEGGLVRSFHDDVAIVFIARLGVFSASAGDVVGQQYVGRCLLLSRRRLRIAPYQGNPTPLGGLLGYRTYAIGGCIWRLPEYR